MIGTFLDLLLKPASVSSLPVALQIEPTTHCNLECAICPRINALPEQKTMSLDVLKKIAQNIRPRSVELSGLGEPFMNPALLEMVAYLKKQGAYVSTTTNFLIGAQMTGGIIASGLDRIKISLDASNAEGYKAVRHNDHFDRIIEGIRDLGKAGRSSAVRGPAVEIRSVITPDNIRQTVDMVELARKLGVSFLALQLFEFASAHGSQEHCASRMDHELALQCLKAAGRRARKIGLANNISWVIRRYRRHFRVSRCEGATGVCLLPWFFLFINADGSVRPCCKFASAGQEACMGTVLRESVGEVWRGRRFTALRRDLHSGRRMYSLCRRCVGIGYADLWEGLLNKA